MTRARTILLGVVGIWILLLGGGFWAIGTDSGTRWLLHRSTPFLPQELVLGELHGSILRGLRFDSIEWRSESIGVLASEIHIDVLLLPLLSRHVAIERLDLDRVGIHTLGARSAEVTGNLPSIELPFDLSIASSSLRNVSLQSGDITRIADVINMVGGLRGSDLDITQLTVDSKQLALDLDASVKLTGYYAGRVHTNWRWAESATLQLAGDLRFEGDMRHYDVQHVLTGPFEVTTTGFVSYESGSARADLLNAWKSLDWEFGEQLFHSSVGSLRLQGSTADFAVDLDAYMSLNDQPETEIELRGDADFEGIHVTHLDANNELGQLTASGDFRWLPNPEYEFTFSLSDLDPSVWLNTVTGDMDIDGSINGDINGQATTIDLSIARLAGSINGHRLQGNGGFTRAGDTFSISDGRFQLGSNRVNVDGSIGETVALDVDFDLAEVRQIVSDASGALQGSLAIRGSKDRPDLRAEVTGGSLAWRTYSADSLSANADVSLTKPSFVELRLQHLADGARHLKSARVSASGRADKHTLSASFDSDGSELLVEVAGGFSQSRWAGRVDSLSLISEAVGRWSTRQPSALVASREDVTVSKMCLVDSSGPGSACIGGRLQNDGVASFDFSMTRVPLAAIPVSLPAPANLHGFIDARLQGKLADQRLTGDARIDLNDATIEATIDNETLSVAFAEAVLQSTFSDNRAESRLLIKLSDDAGDGAIQLSVEDIGNSQSPITGKGDISVIDARLIAILLPGISDPHGRINGSLVVSGSLGQPEFRGEIALTDGSFTVRKAGIDISDIDARLSQRDFGNLILTGRALSGSGQISIQGETAVSAETGVRSELVLSGENFELLHLPDWQVAVSPSIRVVLDERAARITGVMGIPKANITLHDIPETAESPSPDAIVHRPEGSQAAPGRRVDIDIEANLGSDVRLSGFGLTTGLNGGVRLRGGSHSPYVGVGKLTLREGRYKAYGQELEIENGELIFDGPLDNPRLDIRAVRRTPDVVAGIKLMGTPSQLRSEVFSEPALSDAEALSYLLTGRPLTNVTSAGEGNMLNNAAFTLGLSRAGSITSQIRSELGLETLVVEGGADDGRIIAGKRFGNRLLVEYGYGLIDKLGTLLLRYQLNDRIVLESRTGTVSNLDIVYRVKKQ